MFPKRNSEKEVIEMSLVKCPKCGHAASDTAAECGYCGFILRPELIPKENTRVFDTPVHADQEPAAQAAQTAAAAGAQTQQAQAQAEQQARTQAQAEQQAQAQAQQQPQPMQQQYSRYQPEPPKKKSKAPIVILIIILAAVIALGGYWFFVREPEEATPSIDESIDTEEIVDEGSESGEPAETDENVTIDNGDEYYEPAEDGGSEDGGATEGYDVTDDDPLGEEE